MWGLLKLRSGEVCDHKNLTISAKLCHPQIFCENFRALLQASWLLHSCNCTNTPAGYIEQTCLGMPVTNAMSEFMQFSQQTANQISRSFPILALHRKQTRENPLSEFHILEVFSLWWPSAYHFVRTCWARLQYLNWNPQNKPHLDFSSIVCYMALSGWVPAGLFQVAVIPAGQQACIWHNLIQSIQDSRNSMQACSRQ